MTLNPTAKIPPFITRVNQPVHFVSVDVLKKCRVGLTHRISRTKNAHRKHVLKIIRDEIRLLELNFSNL